MKVKMFRSEVDDNKSVVEIFDDDDKLLFAYADYNMEVTADDARFPELAIKVKDFVKDYVSKWHLSRIPNNAVVFILRKYLKSQGCKKLSELSHAKLLSYLYPEMYGLNYGDTHSKVTKSDIDEVNALMKKGGLYTYDLLQFYNKGQSTHSFKFGNQSRRHGVRRI